MTDLADLFLEGSLLPIVVENMRLTLLIPLILVRVAMGASDPLIHASELAVQAQERARACRFNDSLTLIKEAIRQTEAIDGDTAATLKARLKAAQLDLQSRAREVNTARQEAERLLAQARVESAAVRWSTSGAEPCDTRIQAQIVRDRAAARELMEKGAQEVDPRRALGYYRRAAVINAETPGLAAAMQRRQRAVAELPCRGCAIAKKAVLGIVIAGAAGAGAYYGYQVYERHQGVLRTASAGSRR